MTKFLLGLLFFLASGNLAFSSYLTLSVNGELLGTPEFFCPTRTDSESILNGSLVLHDDIFLNGQRIQLSSKSNSVIFSTAVTSDGQVHRPMQEVTYHGPISASILKFGQNHFKIPTYRASDIPENFTMIKHLRIFSDSQKLISKGCFAEIYNIPNFSGLKLSDSCTFSLSLESIAPELIHEFERLNRSIKEAIERYPVLEESLSRKQEKVDELLEKITPLGIDDIDPEDLEGFEQSKNKLRKYFEEMGVLRANITQKESEIESGLQELRLELQGSLEGSGILIEDEPADEIDLSFIEVPSPSEELDQYENAYLETAAAVISQLDEAWGRGDRAGYLQLVHSWYKRSEVLDTYSKISATVNPQHRSLYLNALEAVNNEIAKRMDENGFFRDSDITPNARLAIVEKIKAVDPDLSDRLQKSVNLAAAVESQKKDLIYNDISELGEGIGDQEGREGVARVLEGISTTLSNLKDVGGDIATCLAKSAVAGPYADYYNLRHGVDFCSGEKTSLAEDVVSGVSLAASVVGGDKIVLAGKTLFKVFGRVWKASKALAKIKPVERIIRFARKIGIDLRKLDSNRLKNNPLNKTRYSQKVQHQMQLGDYHSFPKEVDNFAGMGTKRTLVGGDGISRTKIELPGTYDGKNGYFEWIIEPNGEISHRLFVPQT